MKGLGTNVLVRYLVRDDLEQWKSAAAILVRPVHLNCYAVPPTDMTTTTLQFAHFKG